MEEGPKKEDRMLTWAGERDGPPEGSSPSPSSPLLPLLAPRVRSTLLASWAVALSAWLDCAIGGVAEDMAPQQQLLDPNSVRSDAVLHALHAHQELERWRAQEQHARYEADEYRSQVPAPFCCCQAPCPR